MNLAIAIDAAQAANEKKLASEIPTPKLDVDTEAIMRLRHFAEWTKQRGVKFLPCAPSSVAAFVRSEAAIGVPPERILTALEAIQVAHDNSGLASPVATSAVRAELARILKLDNPRWSKAELLVYAGLPIELQAIVVRRQKRDSDLIRKLQNENSELRKSINTKGNTDVRQEES